MKLRALRLAALCVALGLLALAAALPGLCADAADAGVNVAISAGVIAEGISRGESYTLRMTAADAACPMPEGKTGGSCDITLSGPGSTAFPAMRFAAPGNYEYTIAQLPGSGALALALWLALGRRRRAGR